MKNIGLIIVVGLVVLIMVGCNRGSSYTTSYPLSNSHVSLSKEVNESFDVGASVVNLEQYTIDSTNWVWTFRASVDFDDTVEADDGDFVFVISRNSGLGGSKGGMTHALIDDSEHALCELEVIYDTLNTDWIQIIQRTEHFELQRTFSKSNGWITEKYKYADGDSIEIDYPQSLEGHLDGSCCLTVEEGLFRDSLEVLFKDFYLGDTDLDSNPYGELLSGLVGSSDFQEWCAEEFPFTLSESKLSWWGAVCLAAAACARATCWYPNWVCAVCAGAMFTCILFPPAL
ncbi:MAG: hypothetical protein WBP29_13905 [Candidatus Zixiibacteriota bacterium]